ncbi:MAG: hypothetical protein DCF28_08475 [Alphaproteobacteria bacterium]|nr:MAG: hypothetical protein DCF28_08475 [Alphaproteobacteria bacterium]PZO37691.1 MAG: hypothetical protein DCE92_07190 [Alphaproteobacteria bacterium]
MYPYKGKYDDPWSWQNDKGRPRVRSLASVTVAEPEVILTRRLVVAARRGRAMRECLLEVQFNPGRK